MRVRKRGRESEKSSIKTTANPVSQSTEQMHTHYTHIKAWGATAYELCAAGGHLYTRVTHSSELSCIFSTCNTRSLSFCLIHIPQPFGKSLECHARQRKSIINHTLIVRSACTCVFGTTYSHFNWIIKS